MGVAGRGAHQPCVAKCSSSATDSTAGGWWEDTPLPGAAAPPPLPPAATALLLTFRWRFAADFGMPTRWPLNFLRPSRTRTTPSCAHHAGCPVINMPYSSRHSSRVGILASWRLRVLTYKIWAGAPAIAPASDVQQMHLWALSPREITQLEPWLWQNGTPCDTLW